MKPGFVIAALPLGNGSLGICPAPGRAGAYADDLATILDWAPGLVLTMTTQAELDSTGARGFGGDLARAGIDWRHLEIGDYGTPGPETALTWPEASQVAHGVLAGGGKVLAHCFGGCGRSGMALLRLMIEAGEAPESALMRLRAARPCAVETPAQLDWAKG